MKNTNILEVKNLTFGYEDEPVLENFNMSISKNEILLIDGENGAGKTRSVSYTHLPPNW